MNISLIQKKDVDNIKDVKIDRELPKTQRIIEFLENVKNPYVFTINGMKVKMEFSEKGNDINQCLENLIKSRTIS